MTTIAKPKVHAVAHQERSGLAAILSYLVPGLGQIYQGRITKGILFFVCLYGLFFYGQYLGNWRNVHVLSTLDEARVPVAPRKQQLGDIINPQRAGFLGQVWIGIAAWPAIVQYFSNPNADSHPIFGTFQRPYTEAELNNKLRDSDKLPDLGWMYTVVAGVLNILVIYDAFAGPAFQLTAEGKLTRDDKLKEEAST